MLNKTAQFKYREEGIKKLLIIGKKTIKKTRMTDMISIPFDYRNQSYTALVATKEIASTREYRITIMNGELEQLLFGHHIFSLREGEIRPQNSTDDPEVTSLQMCLVNALSKLEKSLVHS